MKVQNKRSPRRLDIDHPALVPIRLNDEAPPPGDSFSWKLWTSCADLAQEALHTEYIRAIADGILDPNIYGQYTLQDAIYCHYGQADYQALEQRATKAGETEIAAFAKARWQGYASYNARNFEAWHIRDVDGVALSEPERLYIDFEHEIATERAPIFGLLAMIPCDQLWPWLATQLKDRAGPGNLYSFWIQENGDWGGAYRLDNFVDAWVADHPGECEYEDALFVYRSCMTCEVNLFRYACGQELLPMPSR